MMDEITDFEVPAIAVRELCIEKGLFTAVSCGGPDSSSRNSASTFPRASRSAWRIPIRNTVSW